jgi:hypothetical protein
MKNPFCWNFFLFVAGVCFLGVMRELSSVVLYCHCSVAFDHDLPVIWTMLRSRVHAGITTTAPFG